MGTRRPYEELRSGIEQLGGSMIHEQASHRWGAWIVTLDKKQAIFRSSGRGRGYVDLNALYVLSTNKLVDGAMEKLVAGLVPLETVKEDGAMFEVGRIYRRSDLHDQFGGQQQGGISTPANHPMIFVFTGQSGQTHGYQDTWDGDGTFHYTGEGQHGTMQFLPGRGNVAIRDHATAGKELHLFEILSAPRSHVRYLGQMVCAGYEFEPNRPDTDGQLRTAIVFRLVPVGDAMEPIPAASAGPVDAAGHEVARSWYWEGSLDDVRQAAMAQPLSGQGSRLARRNVYHRSEAVKVYVQRRAQGQCEGCQAPAPFQTPSGRPYLEPHHTHRLSDGGPDHPQWVIAVCPTCHRRAHYADDGAEYNSSLRSLAYQLEQQKN